ncbi:MAG: type II secretion system F family protein [Candidatus Diapherotrites archaeon]
MYYRISALVPKKVLDAFRKELDYLNIDISEKKFVGFIVSYGFFLSIGIALNLWLFLAMPVYSFFLLYALFLAGSYLWLSITSESKGKFAEKILPDALQLIASNVKSGLTTEKALFASARPEFGPLELELRRAGQKILGGVPAEQALNDIPKRIKSLTLERTIWLLSQGINSGGQMSDLLIQLSDDLRQQNSLQQEISANVSMYVMMIFFAAALIAPMLFGISSFIVQIFAKQMQLIPSIPADAVASAGSKFQIITQFVTTQRKPIAPEFIQEFSFYSLVVTGVFAALTIGIINTGKEKGGMKFIPILLIVMIVLFFLTRWALTLLFGEMLL